ncbi:MAG: hypothetical protein CMJ46_13810 [Planctomyces sp.]|nr:hypothetical protein [Planctomyces sp.]
MKEDSWKEPAEAGRDIAVAAGGRALEPVRRRAEPVAMDSRGARIVVVGIAAEEHPGRILPKGGKGEEDNRTAAEQASGLLVWEQGPFAARNKTMSWGHRYSDTPGFERPQDATSSRRNHTITTSSRGQTTE